MLTEANHTQKDKHYTYDVTICGIQKVTEDSLGAQWSKSVL